MKPSGPRFLNHGTPSVRLKPTPVIALDTVVTKPLAEVLDETFGFIEQALTRIEAREGAAIELHNLRAYLLNVLDLVDRDPGIDAAADDLHEAARALVAADQDGQPLSPSQRRLPEEAYFRFRERLLNARPSEAARRMGLT